MPLSSGEDDDEEDEALLPLLTAVRADDTSSDVISIVGSGY